jgi:hypothetical protein
MVHPTAVIESSILSDLTARPSSAYINDVAFKMSVVNVSSKPNDGQGHKQNQPRLRESIRKFLSSGQIGTAYRHYVQKLLRQPPNVTVSRCANGLLDVTPRGKHVKMYVPSGKEIDYTSNALTMLYTVCREIKIGRRYCDCRLKSEQ